MNTRLRSSRRSLTVALCAAAALVGVAASVAQAEEALPDGRVYEMVTPPNNQGANVYMPIRKGAANQSARAWKRSFRFRLRLMVRR